jgi:signal transduction histidine kinase
MKVQADTRTSSALVKLLNEAKSEADSLRERLERRKKILLSTRLIMGHELKRPTTAIRGFLDLALEQSNSNGNGEWVDSIDKAIKECGLLDELNSLFIELLRMDEEVVSVRGENVDVRACLNAVVTHFPAELDAGNRVKIQISQNAIRFRTNENALRIILTNLLENALAYSDVNSPVEARVEKTTDNMEMTTGDLLRIRVMDRGRGIPESHLGTVFEPFVRLSEDVADGTGLGLTLVRSLVELNRGCVHVRSEMGRGTTVCVTIPEMIQNDEPTVAT